MAKRKPGLKRVTKATVTYVPPAQKDITRFVHDACQAIGEKIDMSLNSPDIRRELAGFLCVVARIWAKHLNQFKE